MVHLYSLGILGTGGSLLSAGWQVADQLLQQASPLYHLYLANRTPKKAQALKTYLELKIGQLDVQVRPTVTLCDLSTLLEAAPDITLIALDATPHARIQAYNQALDHAYNLGELTLTQVKKKSAATWHDLVKAGELSRKDFLEYNLGMIARIAPRFAQYQGQVLIYTNPVDILTTCFLQQSCLDKEQVAGFNEGDSERFRRVMLKEAQKKQELLRLEDVEGVVLGPHNEQMVPIFSQARIYGERFFDVASNLGLNPSNLYKQLIGQAQQWFEVLGSTSPELAYSVAKVINAVAQQTSSLPTLSVYSPWQEDSFCFGQQVGVSKGGFTRVDTPLDVIESERLVAARDSLQKTMRRARRYLH